jgi:hypothetical protein
MNTLPVLRIDQNRREQDPAPWRWLIEGLWSAAAVGLHRRLARPCSFQATWPPRRGLRDAVTGMRKGADRMEAITLGVV